MSDAAGTNCHSTAGATGEKVILIKTMSSAYNAVRNM